MRSALYTVSSFDAFLNLLPVLMESLVALDESWVLLRGPAPLIVTGVLLLTCISLFPWSTLMSEPKAYITKLAVSLWRSQLLAGRLAIKTHCVQAFGDALLFLKCCFSHFSSGHTGRRPFGIRPLIWNFRDAAVYVILTLHLHHWVYFDSTLCVVLVTALIAHPKREVRDCLDELWRCLWRSQAEVIRSSIRNSTKQMLWETTRYALTTYWWQSALILVPVLHLKTLLSSRNSK